MAVTVKVDTGYFATSKKSGLWRWPVSRSVSVKMDFMPILISGAPVIFPPWTVNEPATFLNPPLWLPVTLEPVNPTVDSERMMYDLPACAAAAGADESGAPPDVGAVFAGSEAEDFGTESAGSEQPASRHVASAANRSNLFFIVLMQTKPMTSPERRRLRNEQGTSDWPQEGTK